MQRAQTNGTLLLKYKMASYIFTWCFHIYLLLLAGIIVNGRKEKIRYDFFWAIYFLNPEQAKLTKNQTKAANPQEVIWLQLKCI